MENPDENKAVHFNLGLGFDGRFIKLVLIKNPDVVQSPRILNLAIDACYTPVTSE